MKRLIMLAVLCAFVLSAAAASAADLKASGYFKSDAVWSVNWDFDGAGPEKEAFGLAERIEFSLDFIANENLKAVMTFRHGTNIWGDGETGLGKTGDLAVRKAYVDFNWPGSEVNVKVGHQGVALPNAIAGSLILDSRSAAVLVTTPLSEAAKLTVGYIRAANTNYSKVTDFYGDEVSRADGVMHDEHDLYALIADINVGEASIKPFFVMGNPGQNNTTLGNTGELDGAYWLGVSATMGVGDVNLKGDLDYGNVSGKADTDDASGFAVLLAAEFAGMDMMTPEAYFVYTTGEDDDASNGSERMPQIAEDWAIGSFYFGGDAWLEGSLNAGATDLGFWALGVTLKDIDSFADGLFHYATLIYAQGTNDKVNVDELTTEDYLIELDFNTYYKLYDELVVGVELGYVNLSLDDDRRGDIDGGSAYKVSTGLKYSF